jgi:iron complex outermembrane receptor protein
MGKVAAVPAGSSRLAAGRRGGAGICVCALVFGLLLSAADEDGLDTTTSPGEDGAAGGRDLVTLSDVVVTATRERAEAVSVPTSITTITADDIQRIGATSVVEALKRLGGVHVRSFSGNAADSEVSLRGFGENSHARVLILKDGHRLNRPDMATINWLELPVGNIERIEILRGSHSALYGNYAVGGVINIITKGGPDTPERPTVTVRSVVGSHGLHDESVALSGSADGIAYRTSVEHTSTDGYRERTASRDTTGTLDLTIALNDTMTARISATRSDRAYELPGPLPATWVRKDRTKALNKYDEGEGTTSSLRLGLDLEQCLGGTLSLDASVRNSEQQWHLGSFPFDHVLYGSFGDTRIQTFAFTPKYTVESQVLGRKTRLIVGVDLYRDELDTRSYPSEKWTGKLTDGALTRDTLGVYGRQEAELLPGLTLSLGARKEWTNLKARYREPANPDAYYDESTSSDESAFSIGLNQLIGSRARVFARLERFYRYPATDEIAAYQGYGTAVPFNAGLDAEKGLNWELGADFTPFAGASLSVTGFLMNMDNEIYWDGVKNANYEDRTRRLGVEVEARWRVCRTITLSGSYTYQEARFAEGPSEDLELPLVPREKLSVGADIGFLRDFLLVVDMQFTGSFYQGSGQWAYQWPKLSSYTVWNATLHYRPSRLAERRLDLFVGVDNLLAEEYVTTGYFGGLYPAAERIVKAGLSVTF